MTDSTAQPNDRSGRLRTRWLVAVVCLGCALWFGLSQIDKGWLFPIRIGSGSMAPALLGPALHVVCDDCHFPFAFHFQPTATTDYVCPNCGDVGHADASAVRPGQRVKLRQIDRPQRFDVVAAPVTADGETSLITKRVVGLPGESVRIESGELVVDNRIVCKTPQELKEMAVVVYDDRYRATSSESLSRWRAGPNQEAASSWLATNEGYVWNQPKEDSGPIARLTYHHAAAYSSVGAREAASRLMDNCPYNQHTSRVLNRTADCHVSLTIRSTEAGTIYFCRHGTDRDWTVEFDTDRGDAKLTETARSINEDARSLFKFKVPADDQESVVSACLSIHEIVFGYWDGHFHFVHNGRPLLKYELDVRSELAEVDQLFSLSASDFESLNVSDLTVSRDMFYTDVYGTNQPWSLGRALQRDEYLLLGDNSPISRDARTSPSLGVVEPVRVVGRVVTLRKERVGNLFRSKR